MAEPQVPIYVDERVARVIERISHLEGIHAHQVIDEAMSLYAHLPHGARADFMSVRYVGTWNDYSRMMREVGRAILGASYEISHRKVVESMQVEGLDECATEEDILALAVRLTAREPEES